MSAHSRNEQTNQYPFTCPWAAGGGLQYFSIMEANEAFFLKKRLEMIGQRPRIRGLEREG